ncbi:hypothetical protein HDC92_003714 [Pedobacter sp. AK017]|uniref:lipocalin family protein n=1 Tax=Pedobacter sp. AK017 TaxID=2723073 RepID=UPI00161EC999|nr:lipocalin family protein [Pedobacter sp. AK017]MBB5440016.1 hypothetical protein [Pedobacter sp. AK017]
MRKQITFALTLLLIVTGISACQKDEDTSNKKNMTGKWQVAKIETSVAGAELVTYTGVSSDYLEFRNNEEDEVVVNLKGNNYIGTYAVLQGTGLNISYGGKLYTAQVNTLTANKLEFTANVEGATVKTTEKYYLTR